MAKTQIATAAVGGVCSIVMEGASFKCNALISAKEAKDLGLKLLTIAAQLEGAPSMALKAANQN